MFDPIRTATILLSRSSAARLAAGLLLMLGSTGMNAQTYTSGAPEWGSWSGGWSGYQHPYPGSPPQNHQQQPSHIDPEKNVRGNWRYENNKGFFLANKFSMGSFGRALLQVDTKAGYSRGLGKIAKLNVGYNHHIYPHEGRLNRNELFASLTHKNFSFEYFHGLREGLNKNDNYYHFDYQQPLSNRWSIGIGLGYERFGNPAVKSTLDYRADILYRLESLRSISIFLGGATQRHPIGDGQRDNRLMFGASMDF